MCVAILEPGGAKGKVNGYNIVSDMSRICSLQYYTGISKHARQLLA